MTTETTATNRPYEITPEGHIRFTGPAYLPEMPDDLALRFLMDPEIAIGFALDHLEPFEVAEFLKDRRDGRNLKPWLDAWRSDHQTA